VLPGSERSLLESDAEEQLECSALAARPLLAKEACLFETISMPISQGYLSTWPEKMLRPLYCWLRLAFLIQIGTYSF